jgi:hypothetical protein
MRPIFRSSSNSKTIFFLFRKKRRRSLATISGRTHRWTRPTSSCTRLWRGCLHSPGRPSPLSFCHFIHLMNTLKIIAGQTKNISKTASGRVPTFPSIYLFKSINCAVFQIDFEFLLYCTCTKYGKN